jgi:hypothetical protein
MIKVNTTVTPTAPAIGADRVNLTPRHGKDQKRERVQVHGEDDAAGKRWRL